MKIKWVVQPSQSQSGEDAMIGNIRVGAAKWVRSTPKGDPYKYKASCSLPGFSAGDKFASMSEAKAAVEHRVNFWFDHCFIAQNS